MTDKDNALPERTMLYRIGDMIRCGEHSLDYVIAEGEAELKQLLKDAWFKTPAEAKDADDAAKEEATQAALQAQIAANKAAGASAPRTPKGGKAKTEADKLAKNAQSDETPPPADDENNPPSDDQE